MLMSTPFPPEEGIGNYVLNLSTKLMEHHHEIIIISRGQQTTDQLEYHGIRVFRLPFVVAYPFHVDIHGIFVNKFVRELEGSLDVIHVHTPLAPSLSTRTPIVTTFHSPNYVDALETELRSIRSACTKSLGIFAYRIEKSLIACSKVVTAVSHGVASDLKKYYPFAGHVRVIGNAVDQDFLKASRLARHEEDSLILYAGRLRRSKGVLDLVDSMKAVTEIMPNARLMIIGEGPLRPALDKRITELKLRKHVEVTGFLAHEELLRIFSRASIFVLPSYHEGLPTVVLEAMSCQLAVVATAVRGNTDALKHNETGILVPPRSPTALSRALVRLLGHPELRDTLGKNARRLVEEQFTWDKVYDRVLAAYESAAS